MISSMEIFAFHPGLNKWVEIGNSGMFRPEMLLPMGLPGNQQITTILLILMVMVALKFDFFLSYLYFEFKGRTSLNRYLK